MLFHSRGGRFRLGTEACLGPHLSLVAALPVAFSLSHGSNYITTLSLIHADCQEIELSFACNLKVERRYDL
jgi:hypothetical protein